MALRLVKHVGMRGAVLVSVQPRNVREPPLKSQVAPTLTALRTQALTLQGPKQLGEIEDALEQGLGRLLALREAYPDLKASANFAQLHGELVEVEEHLQYARRFYNGAVRDYNTAIQRVPDVLVARGFGFGQADFFQAGAEQRAAVKVELSP